MSGTETSRAYDRAAARSVAGTRPPARRDQRGPARVGAQRRRVQPQPHQLFAERLLAVLSGRRPVHWMLGRTTGDAYEQLVRLAPRAPLRSMNATPVVRGCRGFHPCPGVIEVSATIASADRVRALAFRLEQGQDLRWRCAAVEVAPRR